MQLRKSPIVTLTTADGERIPINQERHPARSYGRMFHTQFDDAAKELAQKLTSAVALRLWLILPGHLSFTVFRRLDQRQIGQEIGANDSSVSRALKQLHELGAIERKGRGPVTEWKLSPDFGWRGDVASYHAEQRRRGGSKVKPVTPPPSTPVAECILWKTIYQKPPNPGAQPR
jgi:hypothetical protein